MDGQLIDEHGQGLWSRLRDGEGETVRDALIERYYPLVRTIAAVLYAKRGVNDVEFDDYYQFGVVGLIEAVDRFDPDRGVQFESYASHRVRGAILNGVQSLTERREQIACLARIRKERIESLVAAPDQRVTDPFDELAELAVGLAIGYMLENTGMFQGDQSHTENFPYQAKALQQLQTNLHQAVQRLPERERHIIESHYFRMRPFDELAAEMAVSKGRVSQLHKRALALLREVVTWRGGVDDTF